MQMRKMLMFAMRARDQSSIFSTGGEFCPDCGLLLESHAPTLVTRSYALLVKPMENHVATCENLRIC